MAIRQLTVFVENKKGTVASVTDILSKNNVNLRALSIAETQDLGILRLIVNDEKKAETVLQENGYLIKVIDVVGVKIGDAPGKLTAALDVLDLDTDHATVQYIVLDGAVPKELNVFGLQEGLVVDLGRAKRIAAMHDDDTRGKS